MKKVLVTGATGFIGSYVIPELLRRNYAVVATSAHEEKAKQMEGIDRVTYVPFDLKTFSADTDYFQFFKCPDCLIHLAWEGLPNYTSLFHFEENLPRHYAFLKNLVINGLKDITVAGTCFEYGFKEGELREEDDANPANAYAIAKDALRRFLEQLNKFHPFSLKWVRLFYMYGKGQNPKSLFSLLDKAIEDKDEVFNMSGGEQVRDYLPVTEVASHIVSIATQDSVTGIINCSSGKPVKLKDIVTQYKNKKRSALSLNLGYYPYTDYEPMAFWGNNEKLKLIVDHE